MIRFHIKTDTPEKHLTYLVKTGIDFYRPEKTDGGIIIEVPFFKRRAMGTLLDTAGIEYTPCYSGIFKLLLASREHVGLLFGAACAIFLIYLSTFFVWSVTIEGAGEVPHSEILETLRAHGFEVGVLKRNVDTNEIEEQFLADRSEFAFCTVNINGAVAHVELTRRIPERYHESDTEPYNLVSDSDGVILALEVTNGLCTVEVGQPVYRGQLLVSGIMENTTNTGFRIARAEGRIFARVDKTLEFKVPLEYTEKRYIKEKNGVALNILSKRFTLSKPPKDEDFDIITNTEIPEIFGHELPISLEKILYACYVEKTVTLTESEALIKAHDMYRKTASTLFDSAEIEKEEFSHSIEDGTLVLRCEVQAIQNICRREKIEVK